MINELRKAAERLAKGGEYPDGLLKMERIIADGIKLADNYLAEHPADDDEPVTEDWLRSVGFSPNGYIMNSAGNVTIHKNPSFVANRRLVRQLCAALGITLKASVPA